MIAEWGVPGAADFAALERVGFISEAKLFGGDRKAPRRDRRRRRR
jgi:hypothetical protein